MISSITITLLVVMQTDTASMDNKQYGDSFKN